jgi:iron complex outermembrane receptor protein
MQSHANRGAKSTRSHRHTFVRSQSLQRAIRIALLTGTGTTLVAGLASAQSLEEVVVTATRRDVAILDIPYSISSISSTSLDDSHVQSLSDLTKLIAGVSFVDQGPTSRSNFVLRGINANGTDHPSTNTVAPVSTYIGETPLFISLHIDDLDRVEVLRGPQGTLYGSGSLAGTIRFIPKKPDFGAVHADVEADGAKVSESSDNNGAIRGMINVPVSDVAAFRVSGGYQHYAGFINENYIVKLGPPSTAINSPVGIPVSADPNNQLLWPMAFSPVKDANTANLWQARASFLYKPSGAFSMLLSYYHQDDRSNGQQAASPNFFGNVDTPPSQNPFYSAAYPVSFPTGGVIFPHNGTYDANSSFLLTEHRRTDLASADLSFELGFATLTSSTSYYRDHGTSVSDNTGLLTLYPSFYGFLPRMVDFQLNSDDLKGTVEELRLVSSVGKNFDYVVGLFYQHLQGTTGQLQWIPGQTSYGTLVGDPGGNAATLGDVNDIGSGSTDFKDRALFGELTYHVTDKWQVTGGARFFKQDFFLDSENAFPFCGTYCGDNGNVLGNTSVMKGYSVNDHIFKLNSSYKVSEVLNAYVNYAEGFRRGGSSGIPVTGPFAGNPALLIYTPDKSKNFEIGAKGSFGAVNYTAALFYIDWTNFQVDATAVASGAAIAVNGSKARSQGIELQLDGSITRDFTYQLGYSYARAEVAQDFAVQDFNTSHESVSIVTGTSGDPLPNAPKSSLTLALNYAQPAPFLDGWDLRWHVAGSYRSSTLSQLLSTDPNSPPPFKIDAFSIWDAAVDLSNRRGLYMALYAQNIGNSLAVTGGQDRGAVGVRAEHFFVGRPRTVGLRIGYKL